MYLGVLRNIGVLPQIGLGLETILLSFLLGHDEAGGGTIGQVGRVGSGHGSVGLDEGGFKLGHLGLRGHSDTVVLCDKIFTLGDLNTIINIRLEHERKSSIDL